MEGRELTPSASAWKQISEQLDVSQEPRSNKWVWYGIAAGFIGLLLLSFFLVDSEGPLPAAEVEIVDGPEMEETGPLQDTGVSKEIAPALEKATTVESYAVEDAETIQRPLHVPAPRTKGEIAVAQNDDGPQRKKEGRPVDGLLGESEEIIAAKISEVVAQVELLENGNQTVTDAELDSLLLMARKELYADRLFRKDKSVDAMALLGEVEDELDQSFRDQIFESLKTGFQKVRTAVVQRNE